MVINSLQNERVKNWSKLNTKKYRDEEGLFLVEGDHLVNEAIKNNLVKEIIVLENTVYETDLPKYEVTDSVMKKITSQVSISNICAICYKKEEKEINGNVIVLDNIQDPGNFGTIIRSCVAFNIDTIIVSLDTVDLYNPKVIRSSEGMIFNINIIKKDLSEAMDELHDLDYKIYGTKVDGGTNLKEIKKENKFAVVMGNEGLGVNHNILEKCDDYIYIPMDKNCESLNVGVATSIILYEFY